MPDAAPTPVPSVALLEPAARFEFRRAGAVTRDVTLGELLAATQAVGETVRLWDSYYQKEKTFYAVPIKDVLAFGFGEGSGLPQEHFVLRARDGYTVPISGERLLEPGGYLAIHDADGPDWERIGPQKVSPAPAYLIWKLPSQGNAETHPRPWQLVAIEIASFESVFPETVPKGAEPFSPAMRGFSLFRSFCIRCHAINRQGGRVGPDLSLPQNIVEYRSEEFLRGYIRDPQRYRYGNMPAMSGLSEDDLDSLIAYLRWKKGQKVDPSAPLPSTSPSSSPRLPPQEAGRRP